MAKAAKKDVLRVSDLTHKNCPVPVSFIERERLIRKGLKSYLFALVGDFFSDSELDAIINTLYDLRTRPADVAFSSKLCHVVTESKEVRNRYIPRRFLRKEELAVLLYCVSPYALLNRQQTAAMAKCMFPNFFASTMTINSLLTKLLNRRAENNDGQLALTIDHLTVHSMSELEVLLIEFALRQDFI